MFENKVLNFIKVFKKMLNTDRFISKKVYDKLLDEYSDVLNIIISKKIEIDDAVLSECLSILNDGVKLIDEHNDQFIDSALVKYKEYFDNMFKGIDDSIVLDQEQRKAILSDEDYSLIIAGAGSGKTTTMAAKVKYLIDIKKVSPNKIILLAFTNKAKDELEKRINVDFKLNVEVLTFHKLGIKFIRRIYDKPIRIAGKNDIKNIFINYVTKELFKDKTKLRNFITVFKKYITLDEEIYNFIDFDGYYEDYVNKLYAHYKDVIKEKNDDIITSRIKNNYTINGEVVRSKGEVLIANFLYINGVKYEYEKMYPLKVSNNRSYSPDFILYNDMKNIYLEFYGLASIDKNGNIIAFNEEYSKIINKKKEFHKKYGTHLIEIYNEYSTGEKYLDVLYRKLKQNNMLGIKKTDKEIFYRLMHTSRERHYFKFLKLASTFIKKYKQSGRGLREFDELIKQCDSDEVKNQLIFIKDLFIYYENNLHYRYMIDFEDMINFAYKGMEKIKNELEYDYLIIDEYQDISFQRYNFARRLSDLFDSKIVAVGDDWQAIYGFSGSDVDLFTNFYDLLGYADILKITNTYRNSQELIDVAEEFVLKNSNQIEKELKSYKHLINPIQIIYYKDEYDSKTKKLEMVINAIYSYNKDARILLLGRFNADIDEILESKKFVKGAGNKVVYLKNKNINIDFLTIHSSKGVGYDEVIILNASNSERGFPSKIVDEPIVALLNVESNDSIAYPEERRLFYVAITRTKNRVFIMTPYLPISDRSDFVMEILDNENVKEIVP